MKKEVKRVLQINTVYGEGSTGVIAKEIHDLCKANNIHCLSGFRCIEKGKKEFEDTIEISSWVDSRCHGRLARLTMFKGFFSTIKTYQFLKRVESYSPDIIHIHNLHGSYINISLLFRYIKNKKIPLIWTLHDCWAFTAICTHYSSVQCDKWKYGCNHCPQAKEISNSLFDFTDKIWRLKKKIFTGLEQVTIVTPSQWLMGQVKMSFLKEYDVQTIYNGIDLDVFKPVHSDFREKYNLADKKIILGVSYVWTIKKGLDVFMKLSKLLPNEYVIVLVGTDSEIRKNLPSNIVAVSKTEEKRTLAQLYSSADVFVNPTKEEAFGLVNIEALACGTPVITFDSGGSPECVDETCGCIVKADDITAIKNEIIRICTEKPYTKEACVKRAEHFNKKDQLEEYLKLYEQSIL